MIPATDTWDIACWVVYDRPPGHPHEYVARFWLIQEEAPVPTKQIMVSRDLGSIQRALEVRGFTRTDIPEDDPVILETWLG